MIYSIDEIKARLYPIAVKYNIPTMYLFGSYAKGLAHENSDIDLLIDTAGSDIRSLLHLSALYDDLSASLEKQIDLVTMDALLQKHDMISEQHFQDEVWKEKVKLFEISGSAKNRTYS